MSICEFLFREAPSVRKHVFIWALPKWILAPPLPPFRTLCGSSELKWWKVEGGTTWFSQTLPLRMLLTRRRRTRLRFEIGRWEFFLILKIHQFWKVLPSFNLINLISGSVSFWDGNRVRWRPDKHRRFLGLSVLDYKPCGSNHNNWAKILRCTDCQTFYWTQV